MRYDDRNNNKKKVLHSLLITQRIEFEARNIRNKRHRREKKPTEMIGKYVYVEF